MSRHHRAQRWTTHSPKLRAKIAPLLPLPCLNCPHAVMPDEKWQVGHRLDAARGGRPTLENAGPSHAWCPACGKACNQRSGGKLGASIVNSKRQARKDIRPW